MPDESPENLGSEEFNPEQPGGPAIQPGQSFLGQQANQAKGKVAQKAGQVAAKKVAGKAAGEGAADVVAAGTGGVGAVLRPVVKWATEQIVNKLLSKDWWKVILKLYWPQIATVFLVTIFCVVAGTIIIRAYRCFWGRCQVQAASIYNGGDMDAISFVANGGGCPKVTINANALNVPYFPQLACPEGGAWCTRASALMIMAFLDPGVVKGTDNASICTGLRGFSGGFTGQVGVEKIGHGYISDKTTGDDLINKINTSLSKGYPVLYYGSGPMSSVGMHGFVLTGYDATNKIYTANNTYGGEKNVISIRGVCLTAANLMQYVNKNSSFNIIYHP